MIGLWHAHYLFVLVFLSLGLVTAIINSLTVRRFDQFPPASDLPHLSVLVPARNEILNIEACVASLLAQDYPSFEVLVLNDHSTDGTLSALNRLASLDPRLKVLDGRPLPEGWLGKHWACHQLSQACTGDLLLFTDADTRHTPSMLRDSVSALLAEKADLVTAFPREQVITWGERLLVPVISFGIFSFLPIYLARFLRWSALSVTIGQFMLFRRKAFEAIGGYAAVCNQVVDDVSLGRNIVEQGFRWRLLDGTQHVTCRMYHGFSEVVEGFGKNAFAFFDYRILECLLVLAVIGFSFLEPPLALLSRWAGMPLSTFPSGLALLAVIESYLLWQIAYRRFKFPAYLVILYPLSLALFIFIGLRSMVLSLTGNASWKDRTLERVAIRWL
jgi:chlorobactene glucosyltransferase